MPSASCVTVDRRADCAYIFFGDVAKEGVVKRTVEFKLPDWDGIFKQLLFDFDADGKLVGIEVLGASQLLNAETLLWAVNVTAREKK